MDHLQLGAIITVMLAGTILSLAASPAVATRIGLDPFHFFTRHLLFELPCFIVLITVSLLSPRQIRRSALIVFAASIALIVFTLIFGPDVKGARRWITLLGINIQPSEAAKPAFVVLTAWLFAEANDQPDMPTVSIAILLLLMLVSLLLLEPDFGQTILLLLAWSALFFIAGGRMIWVTALTGATSAVLLGAYLLLPHVASRVQRFIHPTSGDTFQVDAAMKAFRNGGWFGLGPGEGLAKLNLPDSHTDFVLAVTAEEYGIVSCLALLALFAFIVIRALLRALASRDTFSRSAGSGLAILFGLQVAINMSVNLQLIPAKGMTLPLISYGGSSMISTAYGLGMILGLTRRYVGSQYSTAE